MLTPEKSNSISDRGQDTARQRVCTYTDITNNIKISIKEFEDKHPFGVYGCLLALLLLVFSIWYAAFQERRSLTLSVISNTRVVDIKKESEKLQVIYDGENILETEQSLRVIAISLTNDGNQPIRPSDYTDDNPLGFEITQGRIVEISDVVKATPNHLYEVATPSIVGKTKCVTLQPSEVILSWRFQDAW